ncbi:short-chain-enoyl-CoA hydratase [Clostridium sediminicola]|uniref:enoyl-CoA hydratase-related protein n=1 Tax=Clostridium sediminicola TaxID=3114879 RepID=UPI0031F24A4D
MEFKNLILEKQGNICFLTINRPKSLNCLNTETYIEIGKAIEVIENDDDIFVTILKGEGKAFVAGADITEMKDKDPIQARKFSRLSHDVERKMETMEKPLIAAVHGYVLGGGCELALSCDFIISAAKTKFGQPEVSLGITPGAGGTQRLARVVGRNRAKEICLAGDLFGSDEAYRIGLVNKVVEDDKLIEEAVKIAEKIASRSQTAVRYTKNAINRGIETDIDTGIAIEIDLFGLCFATNDQKEGMTAFVEKRKPDFKNK